MKKTEIMKIGFLILTLAIFLGLFKFSGNTGTGFQMTSTDAGGTGIQFASLDRNGTGIQNL